MQFHINIPLAVADPRFRNFWIQLIFGAVVQAIHFFMPESRSTILLDKRAKQLRKSGEDTNVYGPDEVKNPRISGHEVLITWIRPFEMFVKEPIVLSLSLLSGFSDALIFTFQEGFNPVYKQWGFGPNGVALAFIPILIGYFIAYFSYFPWIIRDRRILREKGSDAFPPEHRLYWLLYLAPLETIGLFGFAWTSLGPPQVHWIAPMIFSSCIAIANYAIYMSTIDYMVASYGPYSASASGGNGFARDFLAGIAALYATVSHLHSSNRQRNRDTDDETLAPLLERRQQIQLGVCLDHPCLPRVRCDDSNLHLLLEGRVVQEEEQVRAEPQ